MIPISFPIKKETEEEEEEGRSRSIGGEAPIPRTTGNRGAKSDSDSEGFVGARMSPEIVDRLVRFSFIFLCDVSGELSLFACNLEFGVLFGEEGVGDARCD